MLNRLLLIAAIICACFFSKVELVPADIGTDPIRLGTLCYLYLFSSILYFIYKRRGVPVYGKIWEGVTLFFTLLLATLLGGYIKEKWKQKEYGTAFLAFILPILWLINKIEKSEKQLNK